MNLYNDRVKHTRFCLQDVNYWSAVDYCDVFIRLSFWRHPFTAEHPLTLILTAPIHCRASIDSHSDGTHSLQSIHWLSFWRHPFTAEHPLTLILTAPIHCRASIDSHSDGTHSLQSIHWLSFWRHPFTAEHPLLSKWWMLHFSKSDEETNSTSGMVWGWTHVYFWENYPFKRREEACSLFPFLFC